MRAHLTRAVNTALILDDGLLDFVVDHDHVHGELLPWIIGHISGSPDNASIISILSRFSGVRFAPYRVHLDVQSRCSRVNCVPEHVAA